MRLTLLEASTTVSLLRLSTCFAGLAQAQFDSSAQTVLQDPSSSEDHVPYSTRAHWMGRAVKALIELRSPCPFEAFGSVIVNHTTADKMGTEVCIGANAIRETGNPTLHGL